MVKATQPTDILLLILGSLDSADNTVQAELTGVQTTVWTRKFPFLQNTLTRSGAQPASYLMVRPTLVLHLVLGGYCYPYTKCLNSLTLHPTALGWPTSSHRKAK